MKGIRNSSSLIQLLGLALFATSAGVVAQEGPTETRGVTARLLAAIDLGPEIEGLSGRELRSRLVTVEPGGIFAAHDHRDRPGTVYVVQGRITEHRGGTMKQYGPGQTWSESGSTTHWLENREAEPAVLVAVDIFKRP